MGWKDRKINIYRVRAPIQVAKNSHPPSLQLNLIQPHYTIILSTKNWLCNRQKNTHFFKNATITLYISDKITPGK